MLSHGGVVILKRYDSVISRKVVVETRDIFGNVSYEEFYPAESNEYAARQRVLKACAYLFSGENWRSYRIISNTPYYKDLGDCY